MVLRMPPHLSVFVTPAIAVPSVTHYVIMKATAQQTAHVIVALMVTVVNSVRLKNVQVMIYHVQDMDNVTQQREYAVALPDGLESDVILSNVTMTVATQEHVWKLPYPNVTVQQDTLAPTVEVSATMAIS